MIWKGSQSLGEESWIFTGALPNMYFAPGGFCFDIFCGDDPIMDDPRLEDYNKDQKVSDFIDVVNNYASGYKTSNVFVTMGADFQYVYAGSWYKNLDKLIKYVNELQSNGSNINLVYSTPSCYLDALYNENTTWPTKSDDFFPYASDSHTYWTGYFTSRPTLKGFERQGNNLLQVVKQFASLTGSDRDSSITTLAEAMGVAQHHDAVTGTSKQHVADDYSLMLSKGYFTGNDESTEFTYCPLLNISSCSYLEGKTSFVVNVYNSIGRPKSFYVRVPVEESLNYTVQDQQGNFLESQIVPLPNQILNLPGRTSTAGYDILFYAEDIPALGALQYLVEVAAEDSSRKRGSVQSRKMETLNGKDTVVENKGVSSWENWNLTQDWRWYKGMAGIILRQRTGLQELIFFPS
ncbi:Lysosomal alpha-mannosidase [Armadillidium vulgare]|nr:Lysosomal alpha-mannosidase [Armadillidium vulgare]